MILLYIYLKRFCLDLKGLSDGKVVTLTGKKRKWFYSKFLTDHYKIVKINI